MKIVEKGACARERKKRSESSVSGALLGRGIVHQGSEVRVSEAGGEG
jgi:hypothetical protein